jgi:glycosyltransferase involved in cell wall biosynthesis
LTTPISIGIPFYNAEAYLGDAIRSIFAQTHQNWELILIDDGSTDRSLEIAQSVKDDRVRVISDGENKKLSCRLNQITKEARFDLVGRMDADDMISPSRFEKQISILKSHPEIDLVTTGICSITNDNRPIGIRSGSPNESITGRGLLLGQNGICHASILGRKAWFLRNPYKMFHLSEDYELWLRAFSQNDFQIYVMNEPLYYYREESSLSAHKLLVSYACQRSMYKKYGYLWFNRWTIQILRAKSYAKDILVRILSVIGKMNFLLSRRNKMIISEKSLAQFNQEILYISDTKVPGL